MGRRKVQLAGEFNGFEGETVIRTMEGEAWQQSEYFYHYHYDYMPTAIIEEAGGRTSIEISGVPHKVAIVPVSIEVEGVIVSEFGGFTSRAVFHFENGQVWQQTDGTYSYHYAYRPEAIVISGVNGTVLSVEGMGETAPVRRIR